MSTFKEIACPKCGNKIGSVNTTMDSHGTHRCTKCHISVKVDFDHRNQKMNKTVAR